MPAWVLSDDDRFVKIGYKLAKDFAFGILISSKGGPLEWVWGTLGRVKFFSNFFYSKSLTNSSKSAIGHFKPVIGHFWAFLEQKKNLTKKIDFFNFFQKMNFTEVFKFRVEPTLGSWKWPVLYHSIYDLNDFFNTLYRFG